MNKLKKQTVNYISFIGMLLLIVLFTTGGYSRSETKAHYTGEPLVVQPNKAAPDYQSLSINFSVDSLNKITDEDSTMSSFYEALHELLAHKDTVIRIVHLGDSHIQAGYYGGQTMRLLQAAFGNAGRGWIAPFRIAKMNEPDDYFINSVAGDWINARCTQRNQKFPVGLGGIGIESSSPSINFDLGVTPNNGAGYAFNQVIAYRDSRSMPLLPTGDKKENVYFSPDTLQVLDGIKADTFKLSSLTDTLLIQSTRRKPDTDLLLPADSFTNRYYGFELTNGQPGILYHSVGINGAMYVTYTKSAYIQQLALLRPDLLIISLGTNESFGRNFRSSEFGSQVRELLALVKEYMPQTTLLLTTPAESYKRTWQNKKRVYIRNANMEKVAETITQIAKEEGVACWDLYTSSGGKGSFKKWHQAKLLGRDRIHFTREGYKEQGALLFNALIHKLKTVTEDSAEE